jgi:transposase-like protein
MSKSKTRPSYSPEVRERAVRMVLEQAKEHASQWSAIEAIAPKIGCAAQTLHNGWPRPSEMRASAPGSPAMSANG